MKSHVFDKDSMFESERLLLRGISEQDAEKLVHWRSCKDVYSFFDSPKPITLAEHFEWFDSYMKRANEIRAIITEKEKGAEIGMVGGILEDEVFTISYYIGESMWRGQGYAGEAILALIRHINTRSSIEPITFQAHVQKENTASRNCLSKIGFILMCSTEEKLLYEYAK